MAFYIMDFFKCWQSVKIVLILSVLDSRYCTECAASRSRPAIAHRKEESQDKILEIIYVLFCVWLHDCDLGKISFSLEHMYE
uniref:Uncharacterized protein n=1 Tax=Arundo donax TaxID=35708 RepID=A0A0A9HDH4_ARUDO